MLNNGNFYDQKLLGVIIGLFEFILIFVVSGYYEYFFVGDRFVGVVFDG